MLLQFWGVAGGIVEPLRQVAHIAAAAAAQAAGDGALLAGCSAEQASDAAGDAAANFGEKMGLGERDFAEAAARAAGASLAGSLSNLSLRELALRSGREAFRSGEEWGLSKATAWHSGSFVAIKVLGDEAQCSGQSLESILSEALQLVLFIGNSSGNQESSKQLARAYGVYIFQVLQKDGEVAGASALAAAASVKAADFSGLPRRKAAQVAANVAALTLATEDLGAATFEAAQSAGLSRDEAILVGAVEAAAGMKNLEAEIGKSAVRIGSDLGMPQWKGSQVAAQAAARYAADGFSSLTEKTRRGLLKHFHRFC